LAQIFYQRLRRRASLRQHFHLAVIGHDVGVAQLRFVAQKIGLFHSAFQAVVAMVACDFIFNRNRVRVAVNEETECVGANETGLWNTSSTKRRGHSV